MAVVYGIAGSHPKPPRDTRIFKGGPVRMAWLSGGAEVFDPVLKTFYPAEDYGG